MLIGTLIFARVLQACEVKSVSHAILTREATEDCLIIQVIFANVSLMSVGRILICLDTVTRALWSYGRQTRIEQYEKTQNALAARFNSRRLHA